MKKYFPFLLLLLALPVDAALNKWVDANGRVHYSDQPPPTVKAKVLRGSAVSAASAAELSPASAPAAPKTYAEKEAELKKAQKAKQEAESKAAEEQARKDAQASACASARQNLRTLQEGMRMVEIDANGERSFVTDAQRQQRIEQTQADVTKYCQ
jgi:hypothetical protein